MELVFLTILVVLMIGALVSGFPVAFALPGSAILAISLAALTGWLFAGDSSAYFADGGPVQWLTAGVTNFRSLYWEAERDTLIAIPLFIFMGIMLQRSKIAEDLLVAMAQLFGPVPGGLGISVVIVGALLAATTGIVGATVVAMGMISLPAMLRNNYDKSLATGTICASGTLGQIIPPSIVLIILADQLSTAADQASTFRQEAYRAATGEFSLPSHLDVVSASAGDMFMGAIIPGLLLVAIYIAYILISAFLRPKSAPPVPYEGSYDRSFIWMIVKALVPPLALIIIVLGSILGGIATVNQAGAIGAIGAILMGGYRIYTGDKHVYLPAIIAGVAILGIVVVISIWDLNIKNITTSGQAVGIALGIGLVLVLAVAVFWSTWRVYKTENTLQEVMRETIKTTSMVFAILLGAAMLTAAFRAFGGEELVRHALTSLPGGFWTQFIVVMIVIFLLGFFLDFIEIAVVVVPLVAPILLAAPDANITAVWLGVMIGLNMQTSFLTPPFGFALFYLRGVASKAVKTFDIYKGVVPFIGLQLLALVIVGFTPKLVNYLPNRTYLTSENAPPPTNPRLQQCIEEDVFAIYEAEEGNILSAINTMAAIDVSSLPEQMQGDLRDSLERSRQTFDRVSLIAEARAAVDAETAAYQPLLLSVRAAENQVRRLEERIVEAEKIIDDARFDADITEAQIARAEAEIASLNQEIAQYAADVPANWEPEHEAFVELLNNVSRAQSSYRSHVDSAYRPLQDIIATLNSADELAAMRSAIESIDGIVRNNDAETAMDLISGIEDQLAEVVSSYEVGRIVTRARRALRGDSPNVEEALQYRVEALEQLEVELAWLERANNEVLPALNSLDAVLSRTIGVRLQPRLPDDLALSIASCLSSHNDVSLNF